MTRWLIALLVVLLAIAAGTLAFLNPDPVTVQLSPERRVSAPLGVALLVAFAAGAALVSLGAMLRAGTRGWRRWRAGRRARRAARREESTARARDLVWAGDYGRARAELGRPEPATAAEAARVALLAETHLRDGDPATARTLVEHALPQAGADARLLDLLAEAAEQAGDLRGAADALLRAREALPTSPRLARRLRDVLAAAGRWQEAMAVQSELLLGRHTPAVLAAEQEMLCGLRYEAALARGEHAPRETARLLVALARQHPRFVPAWVSAGDLFTAAGRRLSARRAWERGARHRPAVVLLERLERLDAERPERTTRRYRRLRRRHPDALAVVLLLVRHLLAQGDLEQAAAELAALPPAVATHPLVQILWGELHRRRGNHTLATEAYARASGPDLGLTAAFACTVCGRPAPAWSGGCRSCRRWGTVAGAAERAFADTTAEPARAAGHMHA